jgi:hypothetical protein
MHSFYEGKLKRLIDYLLQMKNAILPIEVKSGKGSSLKSLYLFLEDHKKTPYGIKFSTNNFGRYESYHSYPLYSVSKVLLERDSELQKAIQSLL